MKYCTNCGKQLQDEMRFCPYCGTEAYQEETPRHYATGFPSTYSQQPHYTLRTHTSRVLAQGNQRHLRKGMKIAMIVCFVFAGIFALRGRNDFSIITAAFFFGVLGIMFLCLAKTPKRSKYLFGKESGIKKAGFIVFCIVAPIVISAVLISFFPTTTSTNNTSAQKEKISASSTSAPVVEEKASLSDIQKWYENQTSAVSQSLIEYGKSVNGLTALNVNDSTFRFGEDMGWYDCHYTFYFTCTVDGKNYNGEARAFMEYQGDNVAWFHFEIFDDAGVQSLVEHYDDSYDQIIEEYYKELEATYS